MSKLSWNHLMSRSLDAIWKRFWLHFSYLPCRIQCQKCQNRENEISRCVPWLMKIQKHPMHAWNTNQILNTFLSGNVLPFNCTRWLLGHVYNMKNQFWAGLGSQASMYCGKKKFWKYCSVHTEKLHRIKFKKKSKKELRRIIYGEKISM